ncbi:hypothetical protein BJ322DRAFT_1042215 [Thelephora terrestris]|uniref:Uncharacterized protein n=1 Tax=Thelephora terrestris TaxID=56493 RepID=A0A9P6L9I1_9AGAM|nr:hypothetical protein BJ322DRAFT_1042215 [Thelephora terrestris]
MFYDTSYGPAGTNQEEANQRVLDMNIRPFIPHLWHAHRAPAEPRYVMGDQSISDPAVYAYHSTATAFRPAVPRVTSGQAPGIEAGVPTLDDSLVYQLPDSSSHTPADQAFDRGDPLHGIMAVSSHWQAASHPSIAIPRGNENSSAILQARNNHTEEQSHSRHHIEERRNDFDHNQEIPMRSHCVDEGRHDNGSLLHTASLERNQGVALVPAELPPAEINNAGAQNPGRRKRKAAQDHGGREPRRRRGQNETQRLQIIKHIPSDPSARLPTHPDFEAVQQTMYRCGSAQQWKPLPPIDFKVRGCEGINLAEAMNTKFSNLDGRDDPMFTDEETGSSVSLRIDFVGHQRGSNKARQIPTRNHKKERYSITRQKLGHDVAKIIRKHLENSTFRIPFEQMYLVKLHRVSHASWQPEVWHKASTGS